MWKNRLYCVGSYYISIFNNYTILANDLLLFINSHNLKITNVETNNVTLNTKNYLNENLDMEGIYDNETFAITVSLNGGDEINILSSANQALISSGNIVPNS